MSGERGVILVTLFPKARTSPEVVECDGKLRQVAETRRRARKVLAEALLLIAKCDADEDALLAERKVLTEP